jgi:hypothetical protein
MTAAARHYSILRNRLIVFGADLDDRQLAAPVPALPAWTVRDAVCHMVGVCADILDGVPIDVHDPAWTARHVDTRRGTPFEEVLTEWAERGPDVDKLLADFPHPLIFRVVLDAWNHDQDIRAALRVRAERDDESTAFVAALTAGMFQQGWTDAGRPAVSVSTPSGSWLLGTGEPIASLRTTDFELARILIGRRTHAQILAAGWEGDPTPVVGRLHVFGPPEADLVE